MSQPRYASTAAQGANCVEPARSDLRAASDQDERDAPNGIASSLE